MRTITWMTSWRLQARAYDESLQLTYLIAKESSAAFDACGNFMLRVGKNEPNAKCAARRVNDGIDDLDSGLDRATGRLFWFDVGPHTALDRTELCDGADDFDVEWIDLRNTQDGIFAAAARDFANILKFVNDD